MSLQGGSGAGTAFQSAWQPRIGIKQYSQSLCAGLRYSGGCFVYALVYVDRIIRQHRHVVVGALTCHRLCAACLMIAAKFHEDEV